MHRRKFKKRDRAFWTLNATKRASITQTTSDGETLRSDEARNGGGGEHGVSGGYTRRGPRVTARVGDRRAPRPAAHSSRRLLTEFRHMKPGCRVRETLSVEFGTETELTEFEKLTRQVVIVVEFRSCGAIEFRKLGGTCNKLSGKRSAKEFRLGHPNSDGNCRVRSGSSCENGGGRCRAQL
ncbi:hypothetical protein FIBSPDRAFT_904862 [Athelia psychrophila]|uniref:Uncharacterized protein n=1 Tax=Athelia psychrophila TaxID=1759441 RepID=A0A167U727_9AGAM|nr:hypothetical protein FIBSPDRAFT_904862 [Fibularhizoctonia sp. CBS 109695]